MSEEKTASPKIFISYSWKPEENKEWVLDLADRLHREGVHVIIDEWDLAKGHDKYSFMEKMVNDPEICKVLLICNDDYVIKANNRKGGVGEESLIVSKEIYSSADQTKFIPVIRSSKDGSPNLPTFIHSRIGVDMRDPDKFEERYEELMRDINNKPKRSRPPLGQLPSYITDDSVIVYSTAHKFRPLKEAIVSSKPNTNALMKDYFRELGETLLSFSLSNEEKEKPDFDDIVVDRFNQLGPLRDEVVEVFSLYINYNKDVDSDLLISILEHLLNIEVKLNNIIYSSAPYYNEHISLFLNEMFLYLSALLLKYERYSVLKDIVTTSYWRESEYSADINYISCAKAFNKYLQSLNEYRTKRLDLRHYFLSSFILRSRNANTYLKFDEIIEIDSILYYLGLIYGFDWSPRLSCYSRIRFLYPFFQKMKSKRFFNKAKTLFDVESKTELIEKAKNIKTENHYSSYYYNIDNINNILNDNNIAIVN
ncbi:toll/interleukin-1 receptor domain-containing protein [Proteiniphilum sp.]|uniref:toll/interleukin-1 receptor domain-containing protein n=1 Tax=Proteiniphilum sp. TaxID=1926877 RepID=UPI002B1EA7AA|nr:toll/interleukin-1 receptor domain-containing protein [Proteiniphilum sp.]MEA4916305.1 toll/interleukin-1 receptor domain-containing protein [Proteiniphilum sp.]